MGAELKPSSLEACSLERADRWRDGAPTCPCWESRVGLKTGASVATDGYCGPTSWLAQMNSTDAQRLVSPVRFSPACLDSTCHNLLGCWNDSLVKLAEFLIEGDVCAFSWLVPVPPPLFFSVPFRCWAAVIHAPAAPWVVASHVSAATSLKGREANSEFFLWTGSFCMCFQPSLFLSKGNNLNRSWKAACFREETCGPAKEANLSIRRLDTTQRGIF